jgi:hypothetical protein
MQSWPDLVYYPRISLGGMSKTTKTLSQVSPPPGLNLNPGPHDMKHL